MLTKEKQLEFEQQQTKEFLSELAGLVGKYRTLIPMGHLFGAIEIVKMRLFHDANKQFAAEKEGGE